MSDMNKRDFLKLGFKAGVAALAIPIVAKLENETSDDTFNIKYDSRSYIADAGSDRVYLCSGMCSSAMNREHDQLNALLSPTWQFKK